jgi:hypothetical protein
MDFRFWSLDLGFVMNEVALVQVFSPLFIVVPPLYHTHLPQSPKFFKIPDKAAH